MGVQAKEKRPLSLWSDYIWNWVFRPGSPTERHNAGLGPPQRRAASPRLPAHGQLALGWLPDSRPFLSHPLPPGSQDCNRDFRPNFRFDAVSDGACNFLTEFWCPRNRVLVLAQPFVYHSLKLSYLFPYLLFAFSLGNASSVRPGTLPLPYPWLPKQSPA